MAFIQRHNLVQDDEGWWECQDCGKVSKDKTILDPLPCVPTKPQTEHIATVEYDKWDVKETRATMAVSDSAIRHAEKDDALSALMRDNKQWLTEEIARQAKEDHLYILKHKEMTEAPMTTMPGYNIFGMTAIAIPMKPIRIQKSISTASLRVAHVLSGTSDHPMARYFNDEILRECQENGVIPAYVDYDRVESNEDYEKWEATAWVRPRNLPSGLAPGTKTFVTTRVAPPPLFT